MMRVASAALRVATATVRPATVRPFVAEFAAPMRAMCSVTQVRSFSCASSSQSLAFSPAPRANSAALSHVIHYLQTFLEKNEVTERVLSVLKGFDKVDPAKLSAESHFQNDLGLDSLDAVEVCMALEEEFVIQIPDAEADKIFSVPDAIEFIATHPQAK